MAQFITKYFIRLSVFLFMIIVGNTVQAQAVYQPYSYQFYQKMNDTLYSTQTRLHTALKPYIVNGLGIRSRFDSLMNQNAGDSLIRRSWVHRKLFNEHLVDIKKEDFTFYADYLPDLLVGRDFNNSRTTWLNTRGYQLGGTIGENFYFQSSGYENQGVFANYLDTYINQTGIVTGQAYDRNFGQRTKDWSYVTALVSYTPVKYLNIALGHDKNFIGDGYRSMLLSDFSSPYSFLKLTGNLGNVSYMAMWSYMQDPRAPKLSYEVGNRKKWGVFHYLDWNVNNRLSLGFFDSVIWGATDDLGNRRGFDFTYVNPIIFLRPVEASNGSPDNALIGFNGKFKVADQLTVYAQFSLDEFEAKNFFSGAGSSRNKYGWQAGIKGANVFHIKNLNYLAEYNGATPYAYSQVTSIINYGQQGEPLAHPFGANFKELVGLLNYSYKRFDFSGQLDYGHYGLDVNNLNYGKDIFLSYLRPARYTGPADQFGTRASAVTTGNYIGQGLTTNMYYAEGKVAYLLNPKYNLRVELGGIFRKETNNLFADKTTMITIGLRSSFRNLYQDLASYRTR